MTVDDGDQNTADIEMRPRQAIVPVITAHWAGEADLAQRAEGADRADWAEVAGQLDPGSPAMNELELLRLVLGDLIDYTATLRERIQELEDELFSR